jgi:hypothetical protein
VNERRPRSHRWDQAPVLPALAEDPRMLKISGWRRGRLYVVSALELAEAPDGSKETIPQWHLSVSRSGVRCNLDEVQATLRDFDMVTAEQDNHHPGVARHYWLPVDPARRVDCECKEGERLVVDPDGYPWSNDADPAKCRGCEIQRLMGRLCLLHAGAPAERN